MILFNFCSFDMKLILVNTQTYILSTFAKLFHLFEKSISICFFKQTIFLKLYYDIKTGTYFSKCPFNIALIFYLKSNLSTNFNISNSFVLFLNVFSMFFFKYWYKSSFLASNDLISMTIFMYFLSLYVLFNLFR